MFELDEDKKIWDMVIKHYRKDYPNMDWEEILFYTKAEKMMLRLGISKEYIADAYWGW